MRFLKYLFSDSRLKVPRKIALTALVGGVAYLVTHLTQQPEIWGTTLTVFIGGVTLVVQLLADFDHRLRTVQAAHARHTEALESALARHAADMAAAQAQFATAMAAAHQEHSQSVHRVQTQHSQRVEALIEKRFRQVNEATRLFGRVDASYLRTDAVTQFVQRAAEITPDLPALVRGFAQTEITRISDFLKDLGSGREVIYDGEDRDWMLGLARNAGQSIDAISITGVDMASGLWESELGHRYLKAQRGAVARGVKVRRLFVLVGRPESYSLAHLEAVFRVQHDFGIEVRVLDPKVEIAIPRHDLFDFSLFDNALSYEVQPTPQFDDKPPSILRTQLVLLPERVADRIAAFRELWRVARVFQP
ncbi:hypothetical protein R8Z50_20665 [Longispora sp. K20-0274]|uniref:hypothetical protein n=1 Tax=Longispora sp. K20-0274 TaxID=3088255 RepID=UPI0039996014